MCIRDRWMRTVGSASAKLPATLAFCSAAGKPAMDTPDSSLGMSDASPDASLHAAILAAGPSSRFGSPKQLVRLSGAPVLHQLISNAGFIVGQSITVVLGANAREVASALRQSAVSTVIN